MAQAASSSWPSTSNRLGDWFDLSVSCKVQLKTGKVELGQGILTALAQIAAEELDLDVQQLEVISGDTELSPFEAGTVGSLSIETSGPLVRAAAAELRRRLIEAAAMRAQAPAEEISTRRGAFKHSGVVLQDTFWTVVPDLDLDGKIDGSAPLKARDRYTLVGTSAPAIGSQQKLEGAAFIHDINLPNMLHGRVLRKPHPQARLQQFDVARIQNRKGVLSVVVERDFVGVIAESEHDLDKAWENVPGAASWELPEIARHETVVDILRGKPSTDTVIRDDLVDVSGLELIESTFTKPLVGHGSIGPSCGIAVVQPDGVELWSHSQTVFALRDQVARVIGYDADKVRVRHIQGAGCYGHNGADDAAMDALLLARTAPGRPVRVQWSRVDELRAEPLGSPMSVKIAAAVDKGRVVHWELETRSGSHIQRPGWNDGVNLLGPAAISDNWQFAAQRDLPTHNGGTKNAVAVYDFPQRVTHQFVPEMPFRLSALRSLGAFANVFAVESMMDQLAESAGADPITFRLAHLADERARAVIERVAAISNWHEPPPDGQGRGIGFARFKNTGTYCAVVALVEVEEQIVLRGLWSVVDAGLAINPDGIIAQVEGGIIQAASWALKESVPTEGTILTAESWRDYPILSFSEIPDIHVEIILDSNHPSTGVGEVSLGPTAGAIGNAVTAALGARIFELPMTRDRVIATLLG